MVTIQRNVQRDWGEQSDFALDPWLALAFVFPFLRLVLFDLGGKVFAQDVAAIILLPFLFAQADTQKRLGQLRALIVLWGLWFAGQVTTDIFRDTAWTDIARGWAKILLFGAQFMVLWLFIARRPAYIAAYALGLAFATGLSVLQLEPPASAEPWKFGLGTALSMFMVVLTSGAIPRTSWFLPFTGPIQLLTAPILLFNNSRAGFGIMLVGGVYCIVAQALRRGGFFQGRLPRRYLALMLLGGLAFTQAATGIYGDLAESGTLGEAAKYKYETQTSGDISLLRGGRIESLVSTEAIMDSPILGHGSWARDFYYVRLLVVKAKEVGYRIDDKKALMRNDLIPSHSFFFGAWVEAGVFGGLFWAYVMGIAILASYRLLAQQQFYLPVVIYAVLLLMWNVMFSPFGADARFTAAFQIVVIMWVLRNPPPLSQASRPNSGP